ncbi:hypothetical protein GGR27_000602 [Lewinella antarctica]|uniref:Yip1 domain-containing protein n=1 Tax=Neolewinella antarctica TaxID=442734 RepID=A0ABX0X7E8_9BACT|nr:hypothetical protein [Neolewinella antarctica]
MLVRFCSTILKTPAFFLFLLWLIPFGLLPEMQNILRDSGRTDTLFISPGFVVAVKLFSTNLILLWIGSTAIALNKYSSLRSIDKFVFVCYFAILLLVLLFSTPALFIILGIPPITLGLDSSPGAVAEILKTLLPLAAILMLWLFIRATIAIRKHLFKNRWYHQITVILFFIFFPIGIFIIAPKVRRFMLRKQAPEPADHLVI